MEAQWEEENSAPKNSATNQEIQAFQENLILKRLRKS